MDIDHPFRIGSGGRTSSVAHDEHIRQMIEQVLFTSPGERVNRPTFGSGLAKLVFAPNGDTLASAMQVTVPAALQQWLGDLIQVEAVQVDADDSALRVTVQYVIRRTQQRQVSQFQRPV